MVVRVNLIAKANVTLIHEMYICMCHAVLDGIAIASLRILHGPRLEPIAIAIA
jgi:hypothetical protein